MKILKSIKQWLFQQRYNIAFLDNSLDEIMDGASLNIKSMRHNYKDRWFADPFIINADNSTIDLLVEEKLYHKKKGRIARLTVDRKTFDLKANVLILELDSHLSFPAIMREGDSLWFYPESIESGELVKYKLDLGTNTIEEEQVVTVHPLADAVMHKECGKNFLFTTIPPNVNGKELKVFTIDSDGVFRHFQTILFNENIARSAGDLYKYKGGVFRVAQICNNRYGEGVVIQKASFDGQWKFVEVRRLYSDVKYWDLGLHTFNVNNGCVVCDLKGYRHSSATSSILKITYIIKKLIVH